MTDQLMFTAVQGALHAGEILRRGFGTVCEIAYKPGVHNLVTQFDRAAEEAIIGLIQQQFPHHAFLAEESGASASADAPVLWVIDPLDGTTNFAHNIPLFAVSIAAVVEGEVRVGVIYTPMTHELFVAAKGQGAYLNGIRLQVSQVNNFIKSFGTTGLPHDIDASLYMSRLAKITAFGKPVRDFGSACTVLAYLAAGRFDYYWIDRLQPWDIAAGKLIVEEAGGMVTHYDGSRLQLLPDVNLLASNGLLHENLLEFFNSNHNKS